MNIHLTSLITTRVYNFTGRAVYQVKMIIIENRAGRKTVPNILQETANVTARRNFRPRGLGDDVAPATFRPLRPNFPVSGPPPFAQHVKPVNEDTEEEDVGRDSARERDDDESRDQNQEAESEEEASEENVPHIVPIPRTPPAPVPGPIGYRPSQTVTPLSTRGNTATPAPPPPPIQYRPTVKPTKAPRKQIDEVAFKQPIKPPPKPVKPSQAYEIRGKKPVAQVDRSSFEFSNFSESQIDHPTPTEPNYSESNSVRCCLNRIEFTCGIHAREIDSRQIRFSFFHQVSPWPIKSKLLLKYK